MKVEGFKRYRKSIFASLLIITSLLFASCEENSIAYPGAFGENTILRYTPLLNGVKEDVILNEYTGLSSFEFKLTTDKLSLSEKDGRFVFGNESEEPVLEFGDVFAYDSSGKIQKLGKSFGGLSIAGFNRLKRFLTN